MNMSLYYLKRYIANLAKSYQKERIMLISLIKREIKVELYKMLEYDPRNQKNKGE